MPLLPLMALMIQLPPPAQEHVASQVATLVFNQATWPQLALPTGTMVTAANRIIRTMASSERCVPWVLCVPLMLRAAMDVATEMACVDTHRAPRPLAVLLPLSLTHGTISTFTTQSKVLAAGGSMQLTLLVTMTTILLSLLLTTPTAPLTTMPHQITLLPHHPSPTWLMARSTRSRLSTGLSS